MRKHIESSVNQLNDHADAKGSMYSHMLSASSNHEKIKMVSRNDNQKVTTDKYNLFFFKFYTMHKTETKKGVDKDDLLSPSPLGGLILRLDECCISISNVVTTGGR